MNPYITDWIINLIIGNQGRILGEGAGGAQPPLPPEMTCGFLIQLVFCEKKTMWFIGVEVEQETSAPPPKKNPGSAPGNRQQRLFVDETSTRIQTPKAAFPAF